MTTLFRELRPRVAVLGLSIAVFGGVLSATAQTTRVSKPRPVVKRKALSETEHKNIAIFERYSPAVVTVINKGLVGSFFTREVFEVEQGSGSGFLWDEEGHIVSNYHVVHKARAVEVILKDGTRLDATVVGVDPNHDLAVLKVTLTDPKLKPMAVGSSHDLQVGQRVLAIGNPFGLSTSLSIGIVSSLGRSIQSMTGVTIHDVIQTDAAINPGNSGGPLLDSSGRLVGVNTAIVSPSGGSVGVGFAVPVDTVNKLVPELITYGKVRRALLGVSFLDDGRARYLGIQGAVVQRVYRGSPAAKAGLKGLAHKSGEWYVGDVVVGIDKFAVTSVVSFRNLLADYHPGDKVSIHILRDKKRFTVPLTLTTME